MSDRDDIDVMSQDEEKASTEQKSDNKQDDNEIYSTKSKINHAIRQNPLTHLGEKSDKPTFFEKLKRAFSTEDTYSGGFIADEEPENGGLIDDTYDVFDEIAKRLKLNKVNKKEEKSQTPTDEEKVIVLSEKATENADASEKSDVKSDSDKENQKDGKEEVKEAAEKPDNDKTADEKELDELNAVLDSATSTAEEKGYDEEDAIDGGSFNFIFATEDGEAAEVAESEKIENKENKDTENSDITSEEKTEEKAEGEPKTEGKTEKIAEGEPKTEDKTAEKFEGEQKSEDKAEETTEGEPKSEDKSEEKAEGEQKSEEKTEEKSEGEQKSEEKTEEKAEGEQKSEDKTEERANGEPKSEDKSAEKSEGEPKSEDKTEEKAEGEPKSEEKTEEKSEGEQKSEDKTGEKSEGEPKSEDKSAEKSEGEPKSEDKTEEKSEGEQKSEDKTEEKSEDEPKSEDKSAEKSEGEPKSEDKSAEKSEGEPKSEDKTEEKSEGESKSEDKTEEKSEGEQKSEDKTEEKSEGEQKSEEKTEEKSEGEPKSEDKSQEKSEDEQKSDLKDKAVKSLNAASGKFKSFCSKTKSKLIEMWNTKIDDEESAGEKTASTEEKVFEETEDNSENKVVAAVIVPEREDTEQQTTEKAEESLEVDTDALYAELFGTESESEKFKRELYGEEEITQKKVEIELINFDNSSNEQSEKENEHTPMTVIKNDKTVTSEFDTAKLRESLNVIDGEKSTKFNDTAEDESIEEQPLTEEDQRQLEVNQKVLDKVRKFEEETSSQREALKRASAERTAKAYEKEFGAVEPITELEVVDYITPDSVDEIKVKAGKFSDSVRSEYEFYVGYNRLKNVAKNQSRIDYVSKTVTQSTKVEKENEERYSEFSEDEFAKSRDRLDGVTKRLDYRDSKNPDTLEYRREEDAPKIKEHIKGEYKSSKLRYTLSLLITVVTFVLFCFSGKFTESAGAVNGGSERIFAIMNLLLYAGSIYVCKDIILNGLKPLKKIKANGDTGVAVAAVASAVQSVIAVIVPSSFFRQGLNVYTVIVMLALTMNSLGRYLNDKRVNANFRFVSDSSLKYTGKFFHDQRMVATLLSGTRNEKTELVFQKKTAFLRHFLKLSYANDPGEDMASKFALPTIIFSVFISIVYGFLSKSFIDTVSVLSIMLCMAVPICGKALGAVPLNKLAKESLANQAMVVGYPAVENFAESAAVMIDAKELYPEGSVHLNGIRTFDQRRVDDALLAAAAVMISAGGAMAGMFDEIIQGDKQEVLPPAEGVMYEDGKGIIGWVNNERIFVGNRDLLIAHGIEPMTVDYEEEQRRSGDEILYLACAGELVAMLIVGYSANRRVADALRRMEASGMTLLIRTTDVNITAERISKDFGIYHRSIKVLKQNNSNVIRDEMIGKEKSSPAFVATKGGITSFGRAVSGCIQTKRNISLSLVIQTVGVLLGLLLVTTIVLFAGVHQLGAVEMFLFCLFWCFAVLAAVPISQKIQKIN